VRKRGSFTGVGGGRQRQTCRRLHAPLAERLGEVLYPLPQARRQVGVGQKLLAQAHGRMEIAGTRPPARRAEAVDPALLLLASPAIGDVRSGSRYAHKAANCDLWDRSMAPPSAPPLPCSAHVPDVPAHKPPRNRRYLDRKVPVRALHADSVQCPDGERGHRPSARSRKGKTGIINLCICSIATVLLVPGACTFGQPPQKGEGRRSTTSTPARVLCVSLSPDGKRGLTSFGDTMSLWSLPDGKAIARFEPIPGEPLTGNTSDRDYQRERTVKQMVVDWKTDIAVSGDGKGLIRVWNLGTGRLLRSFLPNKYERSYGYGISALALSPVRKQIFSSGFERGKPSQIKVWDLESGKQQATLARRSGDPPQYGYAQIALMDDSQAALLVVDDELSKWDLAKDKRSWVRNLDAPAIAAVSDDGNTLLIWSSPSLFLADGHGRETCSLMWWNAERAERAPLNHWPSVLAFVPPKGKTVVTGGMDGDLVLWDATTGKLLATWQSHQYQPIRAISLSRDGRFLLAGHDRGIIGLSDLHERKQIRTWTVGAK
jgi:WD40 repeat protein